MSRRLSPFAIPLLLALVWASFAAAATPLKSWTSDDILAMRLATDPEISPDGRTIAYVLQSLNDDQSEYQTDVWLVPTAGGPARRLTTAPVADESPRWSPDGQSLAFLSDRPRPGATDAKDDEGKRQVWMIRPDGGEAWLVTHAKGGVSSFEWSRDGRMLAYLSREPKTEERRKAEKEKRDAWTPTDKYKWDRLWVTDVAGDHARQLSPADQHVAGFSFSPDGRTIALAVQPSPLIPDQFNTDLYTVSTAGGPLQPLVRRKGIDTTPRWSPDGKWIAFVSADARGTDWFHNNYACVVPAGGGTPRNLTRDFDERVEGLGSGGLVWTADSRSVLFHCAQKTSMQIFRADLEGNVTALTHGDGMCQSVSIDAAGDAIAFLGEASERPREIWTMALAGGAPQALTDLNPEAHGRLAFRKELVRWKGADGWDIEGLLITPPGLRKGQRVPLMLNVHGGPAGTNSNTCTVGTRLYPYSLWAQKGWAVLLPNPRGSGGYGEAFRAANRRDWGGKDYEDLMRGVDAMVERGLADPNRLAVSGWSYGGYMTSTVVTKTDRFRCAMVGAGVMNLSSMAGTCDIPEFNASYFDAWPWEDPQVYVDHSALFHAGKVKTPTLIVHGEIDDRVPTSQGWEFYTALRKVGVPTDLVVIPRSQHSPREPRLLGMIHERLNGWLDRYGSAGPARAAAGGTAIATSDDARRP